MNGTWAAVTEMIDGGAKAVISAYEKMQQSSQQAAKGEGQTPESILEEMVAESNLRAFFHNACAVIGLPLNLLVIGLILARRSLFEMRNLVWLLLTCANIFVLLNDVFQLYTFDSWQNEMICMISYMLMGHMVTLFY